MITVGGKEIFHDEVVEWIAVLEKVRLPFIVPSRTDEYERTKRRTSSQSLFSKRSARTIPTSSIMSFPASGEQSRKGRMRRSISA